MRLMVQAQCTRLDESQTKRVIWDPNDSRCAHQGVGGFLCIKVINVDVAKYILTFLVCIASVLLCALLGRRCVTLPSLFQLCVYVCVCVYSYMCCMCRSVEDGPVSLSRCSCCEARSPSSWTSSSPTPHATNLCPSAAFSAHIDLCLRRLSSDGPERAAGEAAELQPVLTCDFKYALRMDDFMLLIV